MVSWRGRMLLLWIALCLGCQVGSFMIHNTVDSLCLEDPGAGVYLRRCRVDSDLQQWVWKETRFLVNVETQRCLSAVHQDPVRTLECDGGDHLQWQCESHRLISVNRSLELTVDRGTVTLSSSGKNNRWKSLDEGDICQDKLRSRRQSESSEFEFTEDDEGLNGQAMTEEQREFLRWYYRTEDSTPWVFAILALSFVALLVGCVLLVVGMMGNRNRRKIAKYKAVAAASSSTNHKMEELQVIIHTKEDKNSFTAPMPNSHWDTEPVGGASETEALKPGEIIVTWKDGNVSNLYLPQDGEVENMNE
ncbi:solute carrier family 51 subunit beta isoform X2 [Hoplias malabaricus]